MKKKYLLSALLFFATSMTAVAGDTKLNVLYLDGQSHVVAMSQVAKLEVSGSDVKLVGQDGTVVATHKIADIDKIDLSGTPAGIGKVQAGAAITLRSNGYTITAEGMTDGKTLELYSASGKLVGKTMARGGKATFNAASLAAGVYVVKAQGQSLKMVKR